jgi:ubiquinone/menaquinone biosynthesis C-methylase UbiE
VQVHHEETTDLELLWYLCRMAEDAPAAYDEVAEAYSRAFDADGTGLDDPIFEQLLGDVANQAVLSLACGQGQDARLLASLGASVTGVDVSDEMLRYARQNEAAGPCGITYHQGDAQDLAGFDDESFDGVACHMALMDIPSLGPTIRSVARVLRGGGWFVFSIVHPCFHGHVEIVSDYLVEHRYAKRLLWEALPRHAYHRPLSAYLNELARAGFHVERLVEAHHPASQEVGGVPGLLYLRAVKSRA